MLFVKREENFMSFLALQLAVQSLEIDSFLIEIQLGEAYNLH